MFYSYKSTVQGVDIFCNNKYIITKRTTIEAIDFVNRMKEMHKEY